MSAKDPPADHVWDLDDVWGAQWLRVLFKVEKFNPDARFSKEGKKRIWGMDFFLRQYVQLPEEATAKGMWAHQNTDRAKSHPHSALYRAETDAQDDKRVRIRFFQADHPYELVCESVTAAARFIELAKALKLTCMWCPTLCPPKSTEDKPYLVEMRGSRDDVDALGGAPGEKTNLQGAAKVRVSPSPHESARLWTGSKDLCDSEPNAAEMREWMPANVADFYVASFLDVPSSMQGTSKLGEMMAANLGGEFVPLLSTEMEAGKRSISLIVVCHKNKALRVSGSAAWTGSRTLETRNNAKKKAKLSNIKVDMVALTFKINETSFFFMSTKLKALPGDDGPTAATIKLDTLKELLSRIKMGAADTMSGDGYKGDVLQKYHHCIVFGGVGLGSSEENHNWEKASKLKKNVDTLTAEMAGGRCFSRFVEDDLLFTAQLQHKNLDQRILTRSLAGVKLNPVPLCYRTAYYKQDATVRPGVSNLWELSTQLPFLQALNVPTPLRNLAFQDLRFAPEKGSPYAWTINGTTPPSKMYATLYAPFADTPPVKIPIVLNKEGTRYVPEDNFDIPGMVPMTNAKCWLKTQYLWVTLWDAECDDPSKAAERKKDKEASKHPVPLGSGVVGLDGMMNKEGKKLPVELNLRNTGVYSKVRCKFTVIVTNDPTAVTEAMKIVESKEEPRRSEIEKEEEKAWDKIKKIFPDELERAQKEEQKRLEKDVVNCQTDEEKVRRELEEAEEEERKAMQRYLAGIGKLNSDAKLAEVQLSGEEDDGRRRVMENEEYEWKLLQSQIDGELAAINRLRNFLVDVVEEEEGARKDVEAMHAKGVSAILGLLHKGQLNEVERKEEAAREHVTDTIELGEFMDLIALQRRDYTASKERERIGQVARLRRAGEIMQTSEEPAARHKIHMEEADGWEELEVAFRNMEDDIEQLALSMQSEELEHERQKFMLKERPGRQAIEWEFMETLADLFIAERNARQDVLQLEEARTTAKEKLRRELWAEAKQIADEIAAAQKDTRRLLMKREAAERHLLNQNSKAANDRKEIAELVKLEHDRGHDIVYTEQQMWEELILMEQRYRYEANKVKLKRQFRERIDVEDAEKADRRSIVAKYDTWWTEMFQAFEFGCEECERMEEKRNDEEMTARNFIMQQEYEARLGIEEMDRASRKEARRHTQHRQTRDTRDRWEVELDEQEMRGRFVREEEQAWKIMRLHATASVKRINALLDARQQDQIRRLYEHPWHEQQERALIQKEEDKAWWRLDTARQQERHDALYYTKKMDLGKEETAAREELLDDEDEVFDDLQLEAFEHMQESVKKQVFAKVKLSGNVQATAAHGEARGRLRLELDESRAREGLFEDMVDRFYLVMWGDILAYFEEARAAQEKGKRVARKAQQQRLLKEKKCVWEEEAQRELISNEWKAIWDDILALEPLARETARRVPQSPRRMHSSWQPGTRPAQRTLSCRDWRGEDEVSVADMIRWEHQSQYSTPAIPPTMTAASACPSEIDGVPPTMLPDFRRADRPALSRAPSIPATMCLPDFKPGPSQDLTGCDFGPDPATVPDPTPASSVYVGMTESVRELAHIPVTPNPPKTLMRAGAIPPMIPPSVAGSPSGITGATHVASIPTTHTALTGSQSPSPQDPQTVGYRPGSVPQPRDAAPCPPPLSKSVLNACGALPRRVGVDGDSSTVTLPGGATASDRGLPMTPPEGALVARSPHRTLSQAPGEGEGAARGGGHRTLSEYPAAAEPHRTLSTYPSSPAVGALPPGTHIESFNAAAVFPRGGPPSPRKSPPGHGAPPSMGPGGVGSPRRSPGRVPGVSPHAAGPFASAPAQALREPVSPRRGDEESASPPTTRLTAHMHRHHDMYPTDVYPARSGTYRSVSPPLPPGHFMADSPDLKPVLPEPSSLYEDDETFTRDSSVPLTASVSPRRGKRPDSHYSSVREVYSDGSDEYVSFEIDPATGKLKKEEKPTRRVKKKGRSGEEPSRQYFSPNPVEHDVGHYFTSPRRAPGGAAAPPLPGGQDMAKSPYHTPSYPPTHDCGVGGSPPSSPPGGLVYSPSAGGRVGMTLRSPSQQRSYGSPSPMRIHQDLTSMDGGGARTPSPHPPLPGHVVTTPVAIQCDRIRDASIQVTSRNINHQDAVGHVVDPERGTQTFKIGETTGGKTRGTDTWDLTPKRIVRSAGVETDCVFPVERGGSESRASDFGSPVGRGYRQPRPHEFTLRLRTFYEDEDYERAQIGKHEAVAREALLWDVDRRGHIGRSPDADGVVLPVPTEMHIRQAPPIALSSPHSLFPLGASVEVCVPLSPTTSASPAHEYVGRAGSVVGYVDDRVLVQLGGAARPTPFRPMDLLILPPPLFDDPSISDATSLRASPHRPELSRLFPVGRLVEAHSVSDAKRSNLNGAHGTVVGYDRGRVLVHFNIDRSVEGSVLSLPASNLALIPQPQQERLAQQRQAGSSASPPGRPPLASERTGSPTVADDIRSTIRAEVDRAAADVHKEVLRLKSELKKEKVKRLAMIEQHGFDMMMLKGDLGRMLAEGAQVQITQPGPLRGRQGTVRKLIDDGRAAEVEIGGDSSQISVVPTAALAPPRVDVQASERNLQEANDECARLKMLLADAVARENKLLRKRKVSVDVGRGRRQPNRTDTIETMSPPLSPLSPSAGGRSYRQASFAKYVGRTQSLVDVDASSTNFANVSSRTEMSGLFQHLQRLQDEDELKDESDVPAPREDDEQTRFTSTPEFLNAPREAPPRTEPQRLNSLGAMSAQSVSLRQPQRKQPSVSPTESSQPQQYRHVPSFSRGLAQPEYNFDRGLLRESTLGMSAMLADDSVRTTGEAPPQRTGSLRTGGTPAQSSPTRQVSIDPSTPLASPPARPSHRRRDVRPDRSGVSFSEVSFIGATKVPSSTRRRVASGSGGSTATATSSASAERALQVAAVRARRHGVASSDSGVNTPNASPSWAR